MKPLIITLSSLFLTSAVVAHAYYQKKQFYPTVVHITKSNPGIAVLYLQTFILMVMVGKILKKVFFGDLRPIEVEHLMERAWYTVTETCLAFTVFRDDFTPKFVALFILLFFLKSFHWLAEERIDFMERSPVISVLFHVRIISLLAVLGSLDVNFIMYAYHSTITKGPSVQLVFGFEYAISLTALLNIVIKYILHFADLRRQVPWEHKAVFLLYTELIMSFIKVTLYALFAFIMFRMYTLPVFVLRSMYYTIREFRKAFNDVVMSRRAIRNMNTLYPDATPEELSAEDNLCIICREEMQVGVASKKLPCNHIFHTTCLRSWFQRQQTCPTCRLNILRAPIPNTQPNPAPQERVHDQQPSNTPTPNEQNASSNQNIGGAAAGSSTIPPNGAVPDFNQFLFPPFPQVFNLSPPLPPFESLSDEELRILENQMRVGLEARISCLQNIQTLLDTSVVMMQQYCSVTAIAQQRHASTTASTSSADVPASNVSSEQAGTSDIKTLFSRSEEAIAKAKKSLHLETSGSESASSNDDEPNLDSEQNVVRQRRIEKFDKWKNSSD
ncbi:E3 ubiquitin-protein ligase synoviolin A [Halyomorpha halys]|uniref:E3 ubiquitin-protein ligase synoviolin A n=1 Tax=Halyomorpha halys TaxID=286706 RepID=UPI0006D50796|nr:E3 ubiquitin-protein ligase synoviolin A-like [Halyomorpha halys]